MPVVLVKCAVDLRNLRNLRCVDKDTKRPRTMWEKNASSTFNMFLDLYALPYIWDFVL